jgi:hypothetical protein
MPADVTKTIGNLSGIGVESDIEQLATIWNGATVAPDPTQLAKADAARNQQISQTQSQIDAGQKQVQANDQAMEAGAKKAAAADLDIARLEGIEEQLEKEAGLRK